ncbi:MAG: heme o synthase [Candidatus Hinthialibacter antarcticus]|nr:heme o synthase [Candidatus Hinthialibacter antarcticus]
MSASLENTVPQTQNTLLSLYMELCKARLTFMVLLTTLAGFWVASDSINLVLLFWTMLGTAGAAASANALNEWWEVELDAKMNRTRNRPLPSGRMNSIHALLWSLSVGIGGVILLAIFVNALTAMLGALNILLYVLVYTPMKTRTSLCTLVGAACGAIPPMMGWTAITGELNTGAWILGAFLFVWQIPHFLALAWMYKDDYERGGFKMLPAFDPSGQLTSNIAALYSIALIPLGAAYFLSGLGGWFFLLGAFTLGGAMTAMGMQFAASRNRQDARRLFFTSLIYLPLLLGLMAIDRSPAIKSISVQPSQSVAVSAESNDSLHTSQVISFND